MIGIINYGSGNVGAIANIYKQLRIPHLVSGDLAALEQAERYILPGVGDFDTTMQHVRDSGMVDLLNEQVLVRKKKVLGICVGMQLLAESSEEGSLPGLGWIAGRVRRIDAGKLAHKPKLPHMGWNDVREVRVTGLLSGVELGRGFYFLHSYHFVAARPEDVIATVAYGAEMACGVAHDNVYGFQFHPEKSHANGVAVFRNFAQI